MKEIKDTIYNSVKRIQEATPDHLIGLSTGFERLDEVLGGLVEGTLVTIGGRTGMGKTAFAFNLLRNISIENNIPSLYISLEGTEQLCTNILIACTLNIKYRGLLSGQLVAEEWEKLDKGLPRIVNAPVYLDTKSTYTIDDICKTVEEAVQEYQVKVVFIDYLQLIFAKTGFTENRYLELNYTTRKLKALAKEFNITIVLLSQLNRNAEGEKRLDHRPVLTDLRDSGTICDDSDVVCFVHRPEYYHIYQDEKGNDMRNKALIIVAKNRLGYTGEAVLYTNMSTLTFFNEYPYKRDEIKEVFPTDTLAF
ncbi:DnaB-like helicase C-terminal domain-containing protein [Leyella stercorea]|uniref:DnaB-like helicase C-terminal domain-containing protein n=1 Tax=Leyella stercorea TaxID=363265 RepID=UPI003AAFCF72